MEANIIKRYAWESEHVNLPDKSKVEEARLPRNTGTHPGQLKLYSAHYHIGLIFLPDSDPFTVGQNRHVSRVQLCCKVVHRRKLAITKKKEDPP